VQQYFYEKEGSRKTKSALNCDLYMPILEQDNEPHLGRGIITCLHSMWYFSPVSKGPGRDMMGRTGIKFYAGLVDVRRMAMTRSLVFFERLWRGAVQRKRNGAGEEGTVQKELAHPKKKREGTMVRIENKGWAINPTLQKKRRCESSFT